MDLPRRFAMTMRLVPMKKSRKRPVVGDLFLVQPKDGLFFAGKVLKTELESADPFIKGAMLVFLYGQPSYEEKLPEQLDSEKLLIPPFMITNHPWTKGQFVTVENRELTQEEHDLDYGFIQPSRGRYVDEYGNPLEHVPKVYSIYGLCNALFVENRIGEYLEKNSL